MLSAAGEAARALVSVTNPSTSHLVAYWPLDEESGTRQDAHGELDLTDVNTVSAAAGLQGDAASFDRDGGEHLLLAGPDELRPGDSSFTVAAWVQFNLVNSFQTVVSIWDETLEQREFRLAINSTGSARLQLSADGTGATVASAQTPAGAVQAGVWYLMVGWYDASADEVSFQLDNGTIYTSSLEGGAHVGAAELFIGGQQAGEGVASLVDGLIDEVSYFGRVLTADERLWLYNNGVGRSYSELATTALIPQAVAGALAATGVLARRTARRAEGALAAAGDLGGHLNKGLAGVLSAAGALARKTGAGQSGIVSPGGALERLPDKRLGGVLSPEGEVGRLRAWLLVLAGAFSAAGGLARRVGKRPSGTLTSGGTVGRLRSVFRALAGSLSPARNLARLTSRRAEGVLSASGAAARARVALLSLVGTLSAAGGLMRGVAKRPSGLLSAANGGLRRRAGIQAAGEMAAAGDVGRVKTALLALAGMMSAAGELVRGAAKRPLGMLVASGRATRRTSRRAAGMLSASGAAARARAVVVLLAGALSAAGEAARLRTPAGMRFPVRRLIVRGRGFVRWRRGVGVIEEE